MVLPKSVTPSRIEANLTGFVNALAKLDESDVEKLDGVAASGKQMRLIMPPWGKPPSFIVSVHFLQYNDKLSLQDHACNLGSTTGLASTEGTRETQRTKSGFVMLSVHGSWRVCEVIVSNGIDLT